MSRDLMCGEPDTIRFAQLFSSILIHIEIPVTIELLEKVDHAAVECGINRDSHSYRSALEQLYRYWPKINWEQELVSHQKAFEY